MAILNLFKHRGHFLNAGLGDVEADVLTLYGEFQSIVADEFGISFPGEYQKQEIDKVMDNRNITKRERAEQLAALWHIVPSKDKQEYELIKMLCGLSGKIANICWEITLNYK